MGASGVAISSLISRMFAAAFLLLMLRRPDQLITLKTYSLQFDTGIIRKLLYIGVPSSIETSIFQIGKLLVLSVVAGFGTSATTANAVSNSLSQFALIPAAAIGTAMITISGQCIGAGAYDLAVSYTKKTAAFVTRDSGSNQPDHVLCLSVPSAPLQSDTGNSADSHTADPGSQHRSHLFISGIFHAYQYAPRRCRCEISHGRFHSFHVDLARRFQLYSGNLFPHGRTRRLGGNALRLAVPQHLFRAAFPIRGLENKNNL